MAFCVREDDVEEEEYFAAFLINLIDLNYWACFFIIFPEQTALLNHVYQVETALGEFHQALV